MSIFTQLSDYFAFVYKNYSLLSVSQESIPCHPQVTNHSAFLEHMLGFLLINWEETGFHDLPMRLPALQFQDLILINSSHTNYN